MKYRLILVTIISLISLSAPGQLPRTNGRLMAAENGHYLVHEDGTPFFWLGDTGWEMLSRQTGSGCDWMLVLQSKFL